MKTQRQRELIDAFLSALTDETRPVYGDLIVHLSTLGYNPQKDGPKIAFKHDLHNKQIAKIGVKNDSSPFFALRFSACKDYSGRFADIVRAAIEKYPRRVPGCVSGKCGFCMGEPGTHIYSYTFPGGETRSHCGAYALEIPGLAPGDTAEIKTLITREHEYLLEHEAGA